MADKERWKKIWKYGIGMAALAVSVGAAWFVPGWYSDWQDGKLLDRVVVSSREDIQFLDVDALDIAGIMKMLRDAEYYGWNYLEYEAGNLLRVKQAVKQWEDLKLAPQGITQTASQGEMRMNDTCTVFTSKGTFSVTVTRFYNEAEGSLLTVVMDADKDLIYYLSVSGDYFTGRVMEELGYEEEDALYEDVESGIITLRDVMNGYFQAMTDLGTAEYAAVVNAKSAETEFDYEGAGFLVRLYFDTFEGQAQGRLVETSAGVGCALMYGSGLWMNFVSDMSVSFGEWEDPLILTEEEVTAMEKYEMETQWTYDKF